MKTLPGMDLCKTKSLLNFESHPESAVPHKYFNLWRKYAPSERFWLLSREVANGGVVGHWWKSALNEGLPKCNGDFLIPRYISGKIGMEIIYDL